MIVFFFLVYLSCATGTSNASPAYSYVQLGLPDQWIFYDVRYLSEDGPGGYIRDNNGKQNPVDLPTVWMADGTFLRISCGW